MLNTIDGRQLLTRPNSSSYELGLRGLGGNIAFWHPRRGLSNCLLDGRYNVGLMKRDKAS